MRKFRSINRRICKRVDVTSSVICKVRHKTRSQAVARIADRTAFRIQSRLPNSKSLAQVALEILFDRMPKIVGVTWPRPRPLSGKLFSAPARHS